MQITSHQLDDITVILLDGGLGYDNHRVFKQDIQPFVSQPGLRAVIDLDRLTYLSSWGIGSILSLATQIKKNGGDVAFANLHTELSDILHIMRLDTALDLYGTVEEAVDVLRERAKQTEG